MNLVYLINISYIKWEGYSPQTIQIFSPELFKNQMKLKYVVQYLTHLVNDTYLNNTTLCQTVKILNLMSIESRIIKSSYTYK